MTNQPKKGFFSGNYSILVNSVANVVGKFMHFNQQPTVVIEQTQEEPTPKRNMQQYVDNDRIIISESKVHRLNESQEKGGFVGLGGLGFNSKSKDTNRHDFHCIELMNENANQAQMQQLGEIEAIKSIYDSSSQDNREQDLGSVPALKAGNSKQDEASKIKPKKRKNKKLKTKSRSSSNDSTRTI